MRRIVNGLLAVMTVALMVWVALRFQDGGPQLPLSGSTVQHGEASCESAVGDAPNVANYPSPEAVAASRELLAPTWKTPRLAFRITGVRFGECTGQLTAYLHNGGVATEPIDGASVSVPLTGNTRKLEFMVENYCVAEFHGPFEERADAIDVPLRPAGSVLVDVIDSSGGVLHNRLVYCHQMNSARMDGVVVYRTSQWAYTDANGRATIRNVLPGEYNVVSNTIAEWAEAMAFGVQVQEGAVAYCTLSPKVADPDKFGGFTIDVVTSDFLDVTTAGGMVKKYNFWTHDGASHNLYKIGDKIRCVVRGTAGEVVRGRIQRRTSGLVEVPSKESGEICVTIGVVHHLAVHWSEARPK